MNLFQGARFWLSMTVPQRLRFKNLIKEYGGEVVLMERDADVKLVDHRRKDLPRDTFSYQYVERSINNGRLEDLEAYRVGPSGQRPMGATNIATKSTRSFFTLEEDQILHDWVAHFQQEPNAPVQGNTIYRELAELFPQHPWQSWRSRYIRHLWDKPRPGPGSPLSFEEIIRRAPSQRDSRPKTLPTRTSSTNPAARPSSSRIPHAGLPAPAQATAANNSERVQVLAPKSPAQQQNISPLKRRAVDDPATAGPSSRRPRHESPEFRPESPRMTAVQTAVTHPKSSSSHIPSATTRPLTGLGVPELFPTSDPSAQTPRRISREAPPHPANATEQAARPAPPRPLGDNAFAQSGRFKQKPKPRPSVKDVFQDPVDPVFLELPFLPPSPVQEVTDIETWIDQRVARGAKEYHVLNALHCASMDPERADKVLKYLTAGKGVPNDMPGVWTAEDDECVQAMEHSRVERVLTKHGAQAYQERWEFLNMARENGLIE
ncbi:uncharacterized protein N7515_005594 [Penicillium bovifimosum]|uniref:DNA-binding protein RAP1 n=1 Tax=Penicillium bovifimosum TaxID=126998 RepID=A0A9W9GT10_9EURO|nr:uncharacterized protein N7515_005594 [Penicillium bovifimosum]KAJ5129555.1 hypothetical protein N7515_005594 [Penicillium bovifimosum]